MKRLNVARRLALGGVLLLCGSLAAPLSAHAQYTVCRTDPSLELSDGTTLTLYEDVYDSAMDITGINYQVHVPIGVSVKSISYSGPVPSSKQTITLTADQLPATYSASTQVNTRTAAIAVTAHISSTSLLGILTLSASTDGRSGQWIYSYILL